MRRILIAEDDLASRELVQEVLAGWGYEVVTASDGQDALEKIREALPDLVLLDVQMPRLDGYGVVRQLRADARFSKLPAVALTAYAMRGDSEKALAAGFDAHISKPIDPLALKTKIEELLEVRS